jgi:hypothetical protein
MRVSQQPFLSHLIRGRGFRIALLCFQFIWLNVIIPGHQRGVVELPSGCPSCHTDHAPVERSCCNSSDKGKTPVKGDPAAHCAICFFAARVSSPPVIDFTHPPLRLTARIDVPGPVVIHVPQFIATYDACGPPGVCLSHFFRRFQGIVRLRLSIARSAPSLTGESSSLSRYSGRVLG